MSSDTPANYRDPDPPFPNGQYGWGLDGLTAEQRLKEESYQADAMPLFCTASDCVGGSKPDEAILKLVRSKFKFDKGWSFYVAEELVYKIFLWIMQNIGNCVGASHAMLIATRIAHEILVNGDAEEPLGEGLLCMPFIPYSYGVGREAGNMQRGGDGSFCSAQMKGTLTGGFLPSATPGLEVYAGQKESSLPQGTAAAGRLFGRSTAELNKWRDKAARFKMNDAPRAQSPDDVMSLMTEKFVPLQICSSRGFRYQGLDSKYGVEIYVPGPRWDHSMQTMACFEIKGQWFINIRNQWGIDAHKGSPGVGMPKGSFTIFWEEFVKWFKVAEVMGIGEIDGIPSNPGF